MNTFCLSWFGRFRANFVKSTVKLKSPRYVSSNRNCTMSRHASLGHMHTSKYISQQFLQQRRYTVVARPVSECIVNQSEYFRFSTNENKQIEHFERELKLLRSYKTYFLLDHHLKIFKEKNLQEFEISRLKMMDRKNRISLCWEIIQTGTLFRLRDLEEVHLLMLMVSFSLDAKELCGEIVDFFCKECTKMDKCLLFNVAKIVVDSCIENSDKIKFLKTFLEMESLKLLDKEDIVIIFLYAGKLRCADFATEVCEKLESRIIEMISKSELTETEIALIFNTLYLNRVYSKTIVLKYLETSNYEFSIIQSEGIGILKLIFAHFGPGEIWRWCPDSKYAEFKSHILQITPLVKSSHKKDFVSGFLSLCRSALIVSKEVYDETFFDKIISKCLLFRLKDFGNFVYTLGDLGFNSEKSMKYLLRHFEQVAQLSLHRENCYLINGLVGFSMMGIFPEIKFLNEVQNELKNIHYKKDYLTLISINLLRLDQSIKIDYPDYPREILTENILNKFPEDLKIFTRRGLNLNTMRTLSNREVIFASVVLQLNSLGLFNLYDVGFVMTSEIADLLFCMDKQKNPIPCTEWRDVLKSYITFNMKSFKARKQKTISACINPLDQSKDKELVPGLDSRVALFILPPAAYMCQLNGDGSEEYVLRGFHKQRIRHARKVGYEVIEISPYEYKTVEDKKQFLKKKLEKFINFENLKLIPPDAYTDNRDKVLTKMMEQAKI